MSISPINTCTSEQIQKRQLDNPEYFLPPKAPKSNIDDSIIRTFIEQNNQLSQATKNHAAAEKIALEICANYTNLENSAPESIPSCAYKAYFDALIMLSILEKRNDKPIRWVCQKAEKCYEKISTMISHDFNHVHNMYVRFLALSHEVEKACALIKNLETHSHAVPVKEYIHVFNEIRYMLKNEKNPSQSELWKSTIIPMLTMVREKNFLQNDKLNSYIRELLSFTLEPTHLIEFVLTIHSLRFHMQFTRQNLNSLETLLTQEKYLEAMLFFNCFDDKDSNTANLDEANAMIHHFLLDDRNKIKQTVILYKQLQVLNLPQTDSLYELHQTIFTKAKPFLENELHTCITQIVFLKEQLKNPQDWKLQQTKKIEILKSTIKNTEVAVVTRQEHLERLRKELEHHKKELINSVQKSDDIVHEIQRQPKSNEAKILQLHIENETWKMWIEEHSSQIQLKEKQIPLQRHKIELTKKLCWTSNQELQVEIEKLHEKNPQQKLETLEKYMSSIVSTLNEINIEK